ncbi:GNAT family N-acetyltransferase [Ruania zhangjianzhongii]|uniref:GNAT family N-acetyltransferase n=1 Tax=Ruania zhangjianzhongii TaxID=2603206 RepID=UPI0011CB59E5|nr:GNAT family N-acetyltransferase [Ruania zhangjianzhongii]
MSSTDEITVVEQPDRYQILVGGEPAGHTEYSDDGAQRLFPHTVIDPAYRGQGLAGTLIREALDATRAAGLAVIPTCSAVAGFINQNAEYQDLVPADRRAELGIG